MDGFEKIDLKQPPKEASLPQEKPEEVVVSRREIPNFKFKNKKVLTVLGVIFLILFVGILLPGLKVYSSYKKTSAQARLFAQALKKQDINQASVELNKTRDSLRQLQSDFHLLVLARFVPIVSTYYNDGDHGIKAGFYGLDAGRIIIDSIKPYADVLGLKGQGSFVGGSAQQRIETTVKAMAKITPRINEVSDKLNLARKEIDYINPNDFPAFIAGGKIRNDVVALRKLTDDGTSFITDARPLIKILPSLLGEPDPKRYLILFQNDKELRPTGGFITAYAIFNLQHGIIKVETSNDIYNLDDTISEKPAAPTPLQKYLPKVPQLNLRDTNLSPDFPTSMQAFDSMYKKAGGYKQVDGIISVDTSALVAAMNILGDIDVGGITYSIKTDSRCGCPQVIYQLEQYADQPVNYLKGNRKGIIGDLMFSIMNKAFSSSPKLYWGPLMQAGFDQIGQKHIMFYLYNGEAQRGILALNAGGKVMDFDGDYLHINEANFGGAKSNLYVSEAVDQKYDVKSDGTIQKTVTVTYKNPFKPSDCNLEHGGLCLNATLRDWFRIYVPKGSTIVDSTGSEVKMTSYDELGKTVFEGFLTVRPLGAKTYTITYTLPFKLSKGSPLPLMIQKQPGTDANRYTINAKGKQVSDFPLKTDTKLQINL